MNTPAFTPEIMTPLARYRSPREQELFTYLGATGTRISEMLGVEIDKHISDDFRTITIAQQIRNGKVVPWLKTDAAYRQVDLDIAVAGRLKKYVGQRTSGFLFQTRTGKPLDTRNIYFHLHRSLKELGFVNSLTGNHKAGNHAFRRFRNTWLRNRTVCPEGLRKFWLGHADEDMGDLYDKICEDVAFRLTMAEQCGHGFDLPDLVPTVPTTGHYDAAEDEVHVAESTEQ
jgi:integrase